MMKSRPVIFRRQYLIKKGLQFRYIGIVFSLALLASVVTGYTVFATGWTLLGEKLANVYPQGRLIYVIRTTNLALIRNLLFVSPFIFFLGLLFSHKIAGPVYRIEKSIEEITKGNLALKIKLRKGDEFWDLADIINTMTENLSVSIKSNKNAVSEIQKSLNEIKKVFSSPDGERAYIESLVANLETKINELGSSLDRWTTA